MNEIKKLTEEHKQLAYLAANRSRLGMGWKEIAKETGFSPDYCEALAKSSTLVRDEMAKCLLRRRKDIERRPSVRRLEKSVPVAISVLEDVMDSDDDGNRLRAAENVLDRAGVQRQGPEQNTRPVIINISAEQAAAVLNVEGPKEVPADVIESEFEDDE